MRYEAGKMVHDLPAVFHAWSNEYVRPELEKRGYASPEEFFIGECVRWGRVAAAEGRVLRVVSLGCGGGDLEFSIVRAMLAAGLRAFQVRALDINPELVSHLNARAGMEDLGKYLVGVEADLNALDCFGSVAGEVDVFVANQSLHHVVELEALFAEVVRAMREDGRFLTSDMIGRNGHLRWPSARAVLDQVWPLLRDWQRFNWKVGRFEWEFLDWDCSTDGFEGVRAQDIVAVMDAHLEPVWFLAFGNVMDVFVDRGFGPHFDFGCERDRRLIAFVSAMDQRLIGEGAIPPTHLIGEFGRRSLDEKVQANWKRLVDVIQREKAGGVGAVDVRQEVKEFARGDEGCECARKSELVIRECARQAEAVSERLGEAETHVRLLLGEKGELLENLRGALAEMERVNVELEARSQWGMGLDQEVAAKAERIVALQEELAARTKWAMGLDREVEVLRTEVVRMRRMNWRERVRWVLGWG